MNESHISLNNLLFDGEGDVSFNDTVFLGGNVYFNGSRFFKEGRVSFNDALFSAEINVNFDETKFSGAAYLGCRFYADVYFTNVDFMSPEQVRFKTEDLSTVSFVNTDTTRVFFDENSRFGELESKNKNEIFKIFDERRFEKCVDTNETVTSSKLKKQKLSLGSILTSYRNLRENYEYRLRYDDAGQFFVREMEIKRKYREKFSTSEQTGIPKENNWFIRNFFSFIGLYHIICEYGESSTRPLILFGIIMLLSTAYWFVSSTIGLTSQKNILMLSCDEHLLFCSLERTLNDIVGFPEKGIIIDYVTRISSIIVLATLFLPFRRKFERRFRH